jgi:hypothetical protein
VDRKELIRRYKETPRHAGVFIVRHTPTGRALLGSSVDAPALLNRTRAQLKMHSHPNRALRKDWEAGSPDDFAFEVVDLISQEEHAETDLTEELGALEAIWREELGVVGPSSYQASREFPLSPHLFLDVSDMTPRSRLWRSQIGSA